MSSLTIRIDNQLEQDLQRIAQARHRTKSDVVREMLRRDATRELFELAREGLRPTAIQAGLLTDEDFFDTFS